MWRRIHSNRDPRDTLYRELRKEFNRYFGKAGSLCSSVLGRHPKFFFWGMVLLMLVSAVLSFTLFRRAGPVQHTAVQQKINPVQDGFSQILQTAGKIRETLKLKHLVDSISAKKQLTGTDSTLLDSALDRLQQVNKQP